MSKADSTEPEIARLLEMRMAEQGRSFDQVLNDTLRQGLKTDAQQAERRFVAITFASPLMPGLDVSKLNQLMDQLPLPASIKPA